MGLHIKDENKYCFIHGSFAGNYCHYCHHECHPEISAPQSLPPIHVEHPPTIKKPRKKRKTPTIKKGYGLKLPRKVKRSIMCQCMIDNKDVCNQRSKWEIQIESKFVTTNPKRYDGFVPATKYFKIYVCEEHKKELIG